MRYNITIKREGNETRSRLTKQARSRSPTGTKDEKPEELNNRAEKVIPKEDFRGAVSREEARSPAEERARVEDRVPTLKVRGRNRQK